MHHVALSAQLLLGALQYNSSEEMESVVVSALRTATGIPGADR